MPTEVSEVTIAKLAVFISSFPAGAPVVVVDEHNNYLPFEVTPAQFIGGENDGQVALRIRAFIDDLKCSKCGCTNNRACTTGCWWVHKPGEPPLCSTCKETNA